MNTNTISLRQLADELSKAKYWEKGDIKRVYVDRGYNTKKVKTSVYIYRSESNEFAISCFIEAPSQPTSWIEGQKREVIKYLTEEINEAIADINAKESN